MALPGRTSHSWLDISISRWVMPNVETLLVLLILLLALVSRFDQLGARAMSHDEINHVVPSYDYSQGRGYAYSPMTHGPLQFHLIALAYFLMGDSDFSSRVPAALFSVATVAVALLSFRRYLGRVGALAAGLMFVISPFMLFYGRYARNEAFIVLWGLLTIYAILRYLERGERWALFLFTAINALHFTDKATGYIFAAEELLFLGGCFLYQVARSRWRNVQGYRRFLTGLLIGVTAWLLGAGLFLLDKTRTPWLTGLAAGLGVVGLAGIVLAGLALARGLGWVGLRRLRSLDLILLLTSLTLPLLAALPVKLAGFDPLDTSQAGIVRGGIALFAMLIPAVALGLGWRWREWPFYAGLFYAIYILLFTSLFSNLEGLAVGLFGALGYWMAQQGVERGTQPLYYYLLLQLPLYEFLPGIGALIAGVIGLRRRLWAACPGEPFRRAESARETGGISEASAEITPENPAQPVPTLALLLFWSLSSLVAFSLAGERMPWLTTHIAMPLILSAAWGIGFLVETIGEPTMCSLRSPLARGTDDLLRRAQGHAPTEEQSDAGNGSLASEAGYLSSVVPGLEASQSSAIRWLKKRSQNLVTTWLRFFSPAPSGQGAHAGRTPWSIRLVLRIATLSFLALLAILTVRAAYRAAFILYDDPLEYLVYAHSAPDPKRLLTDLETLSRRTAGGLDIAVAYDNNTRYPYWWYLRNYPNRVDYNDRPKRDLRQAAVVFVGMENYEKVDAILRQGYTRYDYFRMWWPNEDYRAISWEAIAEARPASTDGQPLPPLTAGGYLRGAAKRVWGYLRDPLAREAIWQIWFNRDYRAYAQWTKKDTLKLTNWDPAARMRMYVRSDIAAKAWGVESAGQPIIPPSDPYKAIQAGLQPQRTIGAAGAASGQFQSPRGLALARDGSLYVADSRNHRIQHLSADGTVLNVWGIFADVSKGEAPGGTFNEPWGVAVGLDGSVYVADTWNHRVQKFTAEGEFVTMWGSFGQVDYAPGRPPGAGDRFYGPRGIAVDVQGRVYVADTGNKRIVVFDPDGNYVTQFGEPGAELGQFAEPVGVAAGADGRVYIVDTWNQRVQVFAPDAAGKVYSVQAAWPVDGWYGGGIENKPYIAVGPGGQISITDPENCQVLQFDPAGAPIHLWGDCAPGLGPLSGIAADPRGGLWVSDAQNGKVLYFLP